MRLLLVTPSSSYRVGDFLAAAAALDCDVTVAVDAGPAIPGAFVSVPFDDPVAAAAQLVGAVGAVDGVVGTDGAAVAVAAETARRLGRPANAPEAVVIAADKYRQRVAAAAGGVPQPAFALVDGPRLPAWSTFPAVVKPLDRSASQGVVRVDSPGRLLPTLQAVRDIVGAGSPLVVEEHVAGTEVAVEGIVGGGRLDVVAIFDKPDTPAGPTFPETLLVSPARLEPLVRAQVVEVAAGAVAAVGLTEGPVHVECKVDGAGVYFLELAARTIGGLCSRALGRSGVTLEQLVIRHALGLPPPTPAPGPVDAAATGVLMLPVEETGRVSSVDGVGPARAIAGVTDVVIAVGVGQEVVGLPAGDRYLGFVFARAATADEVEAALRQAWATIEIRVTAS